MSTISKELDAAAEGLAQAKAGLRATVQALSAIMELDAKSGNLEAANAAMRVRGLIKSIGGELDFVHADATEEMRKYYPADADVIQTRGGGGGR